MKLGFRAFRAIILAASLALCGSNALAEIENTATASGKYGDQLIISLTSSQSVPVVAGAPSISVIKIDDTSGFSDPVRAGDSVKYTFYVTNTGNVTLREVTLTDTALPLVSEPEFVSSDQGSAEGILQVGEVATYEAEYVILQSDIDSGKVSNWADVTSKGPLDDVLVSDQSDDPKDTTEVDVNGNGTPDDITVTELTQAPSLSLKKTSPAYEQVFPYIYDVAYRMDLLNTGNQTLNEVMVSDDLKTALSPGKIVSIEQVSVAGFDANVGVNSGFDGNVDQALMSTTGVLAPEQSARVDLVVRVDFSEGIAEQGNIAVASAAELTNNVESQDPTTFSNVIDPEEGGNGTTGPAPTPHHVEDLDFDGAPDLSETDGDRDGDGIPNNVDYDPHGVFYCQENGKILEGGLITVTGPNGSQTGIGTSNNIRIVRDGTDGVYQWFATAAGQYTMTYELPSSGVASTDRFTLGTLDTATIDVDPYSVGSSRFGATEFLADYSADANPFYTGFDIKAGSPVILNNNVPLQFCGTPGLEATKSIVGDVVLAADLRSVLTYQIGLENTGDVRINLPTISDDLDATFGAGTYQILGRKIVSSATGFTGGLNDEFNGSSDTAVLETAGYIEPGETITVQLTIAVEVPSSKTYVNIAEVGGTSPLTKDPLESEFAEATVSLVKAPGADSIKVTKTAAVSSVMLGGAVPYTLTYENTNNVDIAGVAFVDQLPGGFVYKPNSAKLDGTQIEPQFDGRRLIWPSQTLAANTKVTIELTALAGAGIDGTSFVNKTWVENLATGTILSQIAQAEVQREAEAIFECSDVIGTVFDDLNYNGYQDGPRVKNGAQIAGEKGLSGVRISTTTGTLISTDAHGRFNVPCAATPDALGDNVILKLDTRSLPEGYVVTSENPRSVRLTAGKMAKLNFGAVMGRLLEVDLSARAFQVNGSELKPALKEGLDQLVVFAAAKPSTIEVTYFENGEGNALIKARTNSVETYIKRAWRKQNSSFDLTIKTLIAPLQ